MGIDEHRVSAHLGPMKAITFKTAAAVILAGGLAGCVPASAPPAPAPPPAPQPSPAPPPAPPPQAPAFDNWIDAPQTPGTWRYQRQTTRSEAVFVGSNDAPLLRLRCLADSKSMALSLPESGAARPVATIRAQTATRTIAAQPAGRETIVALDPRDSLLDAMAFARGRFAVEATDLPPLYLPSWPEVSRVIEDCR